MQSMHNVRAHNLFSYLERGGQKYKYCHIVIAPPGQSAPPPKYGFARADDSISR